MAGWQDDINNYQPNRVTEAINLYAEQEAKLQITSPQALKQDAYAISLKLDYYRNIYTAYRKKPSAIEKGALRYVRHQIGKLHAQLHPTMANRILYSPFVARIRNYVKGNHTLFRYHDKAINKIKKHHVKEHNLFSLSEAIKKAGFKSEMEGVLKRMIDQDFTDFHVRYADVQHRGADFVLHFKKLPQSEVYYFEKFDAIARPNLDALLRDDQSSLRQTFSATGDLTFTAREAHSLVHGKSVCKSIDGRDTWLVLDGAGINQPNAFRQISFDLQKALKKLPIQQLDNPSQYKAITDALKMGLSKEVTITMGRTQSKVNIVAAAAHNTINVMDKNDRLLDLAKLPGGHLNALTEKLVKSTHNPDIIEMDRNVKKKRW